MMTAPVFHQNAFTKGNSMISTRAIRAVECFPLHHNLAEQAFVCSVEDRKN
jgi:hypothetical protein